MTLTENMTFLPLEINRPAWFNCFPIKGAMATCEGDAVLISYWSVPCRLIFYQYDLLASKACDPALPFKKMSCNLCTLSNINHYTNLTIISPANGRWYIGWKNIIGWSHHRFRPRPIACSKPSYYMRQYGVIVNWTLGKNLPWASCQIRKIAGAHAPGMPGTFSPSPQVSDPGMHHGTCVTHVSWCMPGSLTNGFLWNRRRGKRSRRMRNLQFCVSGKRPMAFHSKCSTFKENAFWKYLWNVSYFIHEEQVFRKVLYCLIIEGIVNFHKY